jgi:hypothetical protein
MEAWEYINCNFLSKNYEISLSSCKFFSIIGHQISKPWIRIRIGIQPKMLDPDQESMNPDPKYPTGTARKTIQF